MTKKEITLVQIIGDVEASIKAAIDNNLNFYQKLMIGLALKQIENFYKKI